ncbi:IS110 family transposase [soil metagenome]
MSRIIGLDMAKADLEAAFVQQQAVLERASFPNTDPGHRALHQRLLPGDVVVMEATGPYHLALALFLQERGVAVCVVNPLSVKRFAQMRLCRAKTDRKDAELIAAYAHSRNPPRWQPEPAYAAQIKQLQALAGQLDKQRTALVNQRQAFALPPQANQLALELLDRLIGGLGQELGALERAQLELVGQHCPDTYRALLTVPGIGPKTALLLIALTANFTRFARAKQLVSYVGLSPSVRQSGTSVRGRGRICKMGMARIRKLLYMCSWSAWRYNPFCKELHRRLAAKGKPERLIKIAVANKLLRQAFAVGTNCVKFSKNYPLTLAS